MLCVALAMLIMRAGGYVAMHLQRWIGNIMTHNTVDSCTFVFKRSATGFAAVLSSGAGDLNVATAALMILIAGAGCYITF